jgi:hypothetical protein
MINKRMEINAMNDPTPDINHIYIFYGTGIWTWDLQDRCSTISVMPPALFCSDYFGDKSLTFCPRPA